MDISIFNLVGGIGLLFITFLILWIFPPKKRNYFVGYRTIRSFKNQRNWDFAQRYTAKFGTLIYGSLTLLGIIIAFISEHTNALSIILTVILLLPLFVIIGVTEYKLIKLSKFEGCSK